MIHACPCVYHPSSILPLSYSYVGPRRWSIRSPIGYPPSSTSLPSIITTQPNKQIAHVTASLCVSLLSPVSLSLGDRSRFSSQVNCVSLINTAATRSAPCMSSLTWCIRGNEYQRSWQYIPLLLPPPSSLVTSRCWLNRHLGLWQYKTVLGIRNCSL